MSGEGQSARYQERLARARASREKRTEPRIEGDDQTVVRSDEISLEEEKPPVPASAEPETPVYRNGKWYTLAGEEVQVKKVIRITWKW